MRRLKNLIAAVLRGTEKLSPTCRDVSALQAQAMHRPLTPLSRLGMRIHLVLCKWCRRYGQQLRTLQQHVNHPEPERNCCHGGVLSPAARDRLAQQIQANNEEKL